MPLRSRRSRATKHTHQKARIAFATSAPHTASTDGSEYVVSDNGSESVTSDGSAEDVESGNESDIQAGNGLKQSVEALQCFYSTFLPLHLCLRENEHKKPQKMNKRKAVYTRDSQTTAWRRITELKCAAQGCMPIDLYFAKRVRLFCLKQLEWQSLILIRSGSAALHHLR
jgi:hypothetical protein